jgi:putative salt-induced outer membrane protein YdiY
MKYDYFLNGNWYLLSNLTMEKDEFKDIKLRSSAGAGVGYQFWEGELSNLAVELGINYVNEDFENASDENHNWKIFHWESRMVYNIINLEDKPTREIMKPRSALRPL